MAEIGRILSSSLDLDEVYEPFAEQVNKLIPFDRIVIDLIDVQKNTVVNVYVAGKGIADRKVGLPYPLEGSGNAEMVAIQDQLLPHPNRGLQVSIGPVSPCFRLLFRPDFGRS